MNLRFFRGEEYKRQSRSMGAELYKAIRLLMPDDPHQALFVPIRAMQFLAVADREEIIFVDGRSRRNIELAWCKLLTHDREDLRSPVRFTCIYYNRSALGLIDRLYSEFYRALQLLAQRKPAGGDATVVPLHRD